MAGKKNLNAKKIDIDFDNDDFFNSFDPKVISQKEEAAKKASKATSAKEAKSATEEKSKEESENKEKIESKPEL